MNEFWNNVKKGAVAGVKIAAWAITIGFSVQAGMKLADWAMPNPLHITIIVDSEGKTVHLKRLPNGDYREWDGK